jgi:hypothetical protein
MADAMLSKSEKATDKRPTTSKMESMGKGKGGAKKKPFENKPSLSKNSEKVDCQMAFLFIVLCVIAIIVHFKHFTFDVFHVNFLNILFILDSH